MLTFFDMTNTVISNWQTLGWLFVLAGIVGWLEQHVYNHGYDDDGYHIFGWLNPRHHLPMIAGEIIVCALAGVWWFVPMFLVLEDVWYFLLDPNDTLEPSDWIAKGLGGFNFFGQFIPWIYVVGMSLSVGFLWWSVR